MSKSSSACARFFAPAFVSVFLFAAAGGSSATAKPIGDLTPPPNVSVVVVQPGDTLEGLLRKLGFEGQSLVEIILGFSAEHNPEHLQPGQQIEIVWSDRAGVRAERVSLTVGDERIQLDTAGIFRTALPEAELDWSEHAVRLTIEDTVVESLDRAGAPSGLGLDMAAALGGLVDFSRDVEGGEPLELLYREALRSDGTPAGRLELRYARIEIGGRTLELAREGETGAPVRVFEEGEPVRLSAAPVEGARISSHFGTRKHPVLGRVRMHSGVDYAAVTGTPVFASAPGTVSRVGASGGYGNLVEIQHDDELSTRYAHLDAYAEGLKVGQKVKAGDQIGTVGATGLATGPHLHYEVRYAGKPVDPLADERVAALARPLSAEPSAIVLKGLREAVAHALQAQLDAIPASNRPARSGREDQLT